MNVNKILLASCLSLASLNVFCAEYEVSQINKRFVIDKKIINKISVSVGDTVHFKNDDPFFHNIFSLSDTSTFDLGSYPKGQSKSITFNKPGTIEVECAIHPTMRLIIEVKE